MNAVPIFDKQMNSSQFAMNGMAQDIDALSHDVNTWAVFLVDLIRDLEMFAMANDPYHPERYEQMLGLVKGKIETRLKEGSW